MRGKFQKLFVSNNPEVDRLISKPIENWTSMDRFSCFKLYYQKYNGRAFRHNKNYGLMLIMLKRIQLSNKNFVKYLKWLGKNKKLYSLYALKNHLKYYKSIEGIYD